MVKTAAEFLGLFTGAVDFGTFITDLLLIAEKVFDTVLEGVLYLALKIFGLDKDLGVLSALSVILTDIAGWIDAWISNLVCWLLNEMLSPIAIILSSIVNSDFCLGCTKRTSSYYMADWLPDNCLFPGVIEQTLTGEAKGFALKFGRFRKAAKEKLATMVQIRMGKRYKICSKGAVKYPILTCEQIQSCVNSKEDAWDVNEGSPPEEKHWQSAGPYVYNSVLGSYGAKAIIAYTDSSVKPNRDTINDMFGYDVCDGADGIMANLRDIGQSQALNSFCNYAWSVGEHQRPIDAERRLLLETHCSSTKSDTLPDGRTNTGCMHFIVEDFLWETPSDRYVEGLNSNNVYVAGTITSSSTGWPIKYPFQVHTTGTGTSGTGVRVTEMKRTFPPAPAPSPATAAAAGSPFYKLLWKNDLRINWDTEKTPPSWSYSSPMYPIGSTLWTTRSNPLYGTQQQPLCGKTCVSVGICPIADASDNDIIAHRPDMPGTWDTSVDGRWVGGQERLYTPNLLSCQSYCTADTTCTHFSWFDNTLPVEDQFWYTTPEREASGLGPDRAISSSHINVAITNRVRSDGSSSCKLWSSCPSDGLLGQPMHMYDDGTGFVTYARVNDNPEDHSVNTDNKFYFTECLNQCSMFTDRTPYAGLVRRSFNSNVPKDTDTDLRTFCVCIPESTLERMLVADSDLCTFAYHTTSGRNKKGLFDGKTFNDAESCAGFSRAERFGLGLAKDAIYWDETQPTCGFAFNDPGNIDNYISLYKTRSMAATGTWQTAITDLGTFLSTDVEGGGKGLGRRLRANEPEKFDAAALARAYTWNESKLVSRCDLIGRTALAMNASNMTLRPLEVVELEDCIELRSYGEMMSHSLFVDDFPKELFYTWQTKYLLGLDAFMGSYLYLNWAWHYNASHSNQTDITEIVNASLMYPDTFLSLMKIVSEKVHTKATAYGEPMDLGDDQLRTYYGNESAVETMDAVVSDAATVSGRIYNELVQHNISGEWEHMTDTLDLLGHHILQYSGRHPETLPEWGEPATRRRLLGFDGTSPYRLTLRHRRLSTSKLECDANSVACTGCSVVDNLLDETVHGFTSFAHYYSTSFPDAIEGFNAALGAPGDAERVTLRSSEVHANVSQAVRRRLLSVPSSAPTLPPSRSVKDLKASAAESDFLNATLLFFDTTDDAEVPIYGYGLSYYLAWPFEKACDMRATIYCEAETVQDREEDIAIGISATVALNVFIVFSYMNLPLAQLIPVPMIVTQAVASAFLYMGLVYGYHPFCLPFVPHCLVDDLVHVFETRVMDNLRCLCQIAPSLYEGACTDCQSLEIRSFNAKQCSTVPHFDDLSILWAPLLVARVYMPRLLSWSFGLPLVSNVVASSAALQHIETARPDALAIDCALAYIPNAAAVGVIGASGAFVLVFWSRALTKLPLAFARLGWLGVQQELNAAQLLLTAEFSPATFVIGLGVVGALLAVAFIL